MDQERNLEFVDGFGDYNRITAADEVFRLMGLDMASSESITIIGINRLWWTPINEKVDWSREGF